MTNLEIKSKEHLEGAIDALMLFMSEEDPKLLDSWRKVGYYVTETENSYKACFTFRYGDALQCIDDWWFIILKTESIYKLRRYINDFCERFTETTLRYADYTGE